MSATIITQKKFIKLGKIGQPINQSISLIADLRPEGRIANEMPMK